MSEEAKKVFEHIKNDGWILDKAVKIAEAYAGSANANPECVDLVIERVVHVLKTGEIN